MRQALTSVRKPIWKCLVVAACLFPDTVFAQLATDEVPRTRVLPTPEQVRADVDKSRFRLGPIRLIPSLQLVNAGYDSNIFGIPEGQQPVSDWTATIQAGARWILPLGSKMYFRGSALPEYTWYRDLTSRRTFGGVYQASMLGIFNRMSLEASAYATRTFEFPAFYIQTRVIQSIRDGSASLEVEAARDLSIFAKAEGQRVRFSQAGEPGFGLNVARFDRDDVAAQGGARYRISPAWDISAGIEGTRTEFVSPPEGRDNQSVAYNLGVHYDRPRFYVTLSGGYREIRPYKNSTFRSTSTPTGSYFASWFLVPDVELQVYGGRRVVYGRGSETTPYAYETHNGGGLNVQVRTRLLLRGYGEYGETESPFSPRTDKITALGGGFSTRFFRGAVLTALVSRTSFRADQPDLRFSVFRFTMGVTFEGELSR